MEEKKTIIHEEMLQNLPEVVQQYLMSASVVGKERIQKTIIHQEGLLRTQPEQAWAPIETTELYTINPPGFLWKGKTTVLPLVKITARDTFTDGEGHMQVKLLSLLKVADVAGLEVNQIALLRFLSAMVWYPTAFLENFVSWETVDEHTVKVKLSPYDSEITGTYQINDEGKIEKLQALRYRNTGKGFEQAQWSISYHSYKELNGLVVPTESESSWHFDIDDFLYMRTRIKSTQYNKSNE